MTTPRLEQLIRSGARRAARRVSLDEALLSDRGLSYAWYRTRLLALKIPFGVALHTAELFAFAEAYDLGVIGPMLALRSLAAVGMALWWGALEGMRSDVRGHARSGDWGRAERVVRSYLALGVDVALLALALAVGSVVLLPSHFGGFDIFNAYALSCSLRFGAEALARAYHGGIFAVRRVYRPAWSLFLPDVFELGVALVLWRVLGLWAFSIAGLCGGLLSAGLTLWFAREAYRQQKGFSPRWFGIGKARADLAPGRLLALGRHALSNLATHVDAAVILLLSVGLPEGVMPRFLVLLHALRPLLGAAGSSARAFYFDFKKLGLGEIAFFRRRLTQVVTHTAWLQAALACALALLLNALLFRQRLGSDFLLVLAYVVARSLLSVEQLRLFTSERYDVLARGSLAILSSLGVARLTLSDPKHWVLLCVLLVAGLALWYRRRASDTAAPAVTTGASVSPYRWLRSLADHPGSARATWLRLDRRPGVASGALSHALTSTFGDVQVARLNSHSLLLWDAHPSRSRAQWTELLCEASAGCVQELRMTERLDSGAATLRAALELPELAAWLSSAAAPERGSLELIEQFQREFPDGKLLSLKRTPERSFFSRRAQVAATLHAIYASCAGRPRVNRAAGDPEVAVYCPAGEPELVFLASSSHDPGAFNAFARSVHAATVAATLSGSAAAPAR